MKMVFGITGTTGTGTLQESSPPPCPLLLSKADLVVESHLFSFMCFEFLLAPLYHFLDLNNACLLVLRIAELLIIE